MVCVRVYHDMLADVHGVPFQLKMIVFIVLSMNEPKQRDFHLRRINNFASASVWWQSCIQVAENFVVRPARLKHLQLNHFARFVQHFTITSNELNRIVALNWVASMSIGQNTSSISVHFLFFFSAYFSLFTIFTSISVHFLSLSYPDNKNTTRNRFNFKLKSIFEHITFYGNVRRVANVLFSDVVCV